MRPTRCVAIGTAALIMALVPGKARGQDAALLLGQYDQTMLIVVHGDSVAVRRGTGLIVPRPTGWWRVGVDAPTIAYPELRARLYPQWRADSIRSDSLERWAAEHPDTTQTADPVAVEDSTRPDTVPEPETNMHGEELGHDACFGHVVWVVPLGTMPVLPDSICAGNEEPAGEYSFTFVSPAVLTMSAGITTDYSYNFARGLIVARLDAVAKHPIVGFASHDYSEDAVDPVAALGVRSRDATWMHEAVRCNLEYNGGRDPSGEDSVSYDYQGTWIARASGRWRFERYYANTSYVGRGSESTCPLRIPVPAALTGWDRLTVSMAAIRKRVPKAFDAFTSPNGTVAVVLDSTATRVFRIEQATLGRELAVIPPDPGWIRRVEMTTISQWATGAAARRWEKELAEVLPESIAVSGPSSWKGAQR